MDSQEKYREILEKYCKLYDDNVGNINLYEYIPENEYEGIGWLFELYDNHVVFRIVHSNFLFGDRFNHYFTSAEKLQSFFESLT